MKLHYFLWLPYFIVGLIGLFWICLLLLLWVFFFCKFVLVFLITTLAWLRQLRSSGNEEVVGTSQNHRIVGLGGTSGDNPVQPSCQGRVTWSSWCGNVSSWFWMSPEREFQLFQCSGTLNVKKFFLMLRWNFLCFSLWALLLVLLLCIIENSLAPFSWPPSPLWKCQYLKMVLTVYQSNVLRKAKRRKKSLFCENPMYWVVFVRWTKD